MQEKTKIIRSILAAKALKKPYKINFALLFAVTPAAKPVMSDESLRKIPKL